MHPLKYGFEVLKSWIDVTYLELTGQSGHSGTNKSDWLQLSASIFEETKLETKLAIKYLHQNILQPFLCIIFIIFIIYLESSKNVFFCNWTIILTYWFICKVNDHGQKFVTFWKSQKRLFLENSKYLLNKWC